MMKPYQPVPEVERARRAGEACWCALTVVFCVLTGGLLATSLVLHVLTIAALVHFGRVLMKRVGCESLWVLPPKNKRA